MNKKISSQIDLAQEMLCKLHLDELSDYVVFSTNWLDFSLSNEHNLVWF
jgi:hypothetical protein